MSKIKKWFEALTTERIRQTDEMIANGYESQQHQPFVANERFKVFSVQHSLRLGDLILKLLELRRAQALTTDERTEADADYGQYHQQYIETRQ